MRFHHRLHGHVPDCHPFRHEAAQEHLCSAKTVLTTGLLAVSTAGFAQPARTTAAYMENLELILSLAGTAFSLFIACVVFIVKLIRGYTTKKKLKNSYVLLDAVAPLMEIAESFTNYSGEEKKEYVMTKVNQFALENGIKFDAQAACAYLGIANAEGAQNKNKELCGKAYKNANFLTDFGGLEFIYFKD